MSPDRSRAWLRPGAVAQRVPLFDGHGAYCVDNALQDPERLVAWAAAQTFEPANANAYPGLLAPAPEALLVELTSLFDVQVRNRLGGRRTISRYARLGLVTLSPSALQPAQWMCHRDPLALDPREAVLAAALLYAFADPSLGGTRFYRPRIAEPELAQLIRDMGRLDAAAFSARYGVAPGYMAEGNAYFDCVAEIPAAPNRLVFYDGGLFHSGHIPHPERLSPNPAQGRLTLNAFFACRRPAQGAAAG